MPLPSPSGKEKRKNFVSRCVSDLTRKGEGDSPAQRVAICNSRFRKSSAEEEKKEKKKKSKKPSGKTYSELTEEEVEALRKVMNNEKHA